MVCKCQPQVQADNLPSTVCFPYQSWPEEKGVLVEFRLMYKGKLPAQNSGGGFIKEKHLVRRQLHRQLRELWQQNTFLKNNAELSTQVLDDKGELIKTISNLERNSLKYERCGYKCVPLITKDRNLACTIDILFLRRDGPGNLVKSGGDIDNRIKVLFDGLRMPDNCDEVRGMPPEPDEDIFFCLLEDDSLITEVNITTDRLLTPLETGESIHDVFIVLSVKTLMVSGSRGWHEFY